MYEVDGPRYIYRAAVSRRQCVRQKGRSFLEKAFGGDVGALVAHFVTEASLDQDQIEQLRQLLAQKKKPEGEAKMITLVDTTGPAVWRASWQAAVLAVRGRADLAVVRRTHFAALALSLLEHRRHPSLTGGDAGESLERV